MFPRVVITQSKLFMGGAQRGLFLAKEFESSLENIIRVYLHLNAGGQEQKEPGGRGLGVGHVSWRVGKVSAGGCG